MLLKLKKYGESTVARHFFENNHHISDLSWQVIERIYAIDQHNVGVTLLKREAFWINKLESLAPKGLNESNLTSVNECNLSVFL